jgi:hypothetical protein
MDALPPLLALLCLLFSGWVNRRQQAVIEYVLEENRVLRTAQESDDCASPTTSNATGRERKILGRRR